MTKHEDCRGFFPAQIEAESHTYSVLMLKFIKTWKLYSQEFCEMSYYIVPVLQISVCFLPVWQSAAGDFPCLLRSS